MEEIDFPEPPPLSLSPSINFPIQLVARRRAEGGYFLADRVFENVIRARG